MSEITDKNLLNKFNDVPKGQEITDPNVLQSLNVPSQASQPTQDKPVRNQLDALAGGMARGVTLGAADPIVSGVGATVTGYVQSLMDSLSLLGITPDVELPSPSDVFTQSMETQRQNKAAERENFPATSIGGEIAGGLLTSLGGAARIPQAMKAFPILTSGGLGATEGAIKNAFESKALEDIPGNALIGGGIGLGAGLAGGAIGDRVLRPLGGAIARGFQNFGRTTTRQADDILAKSLQDTFDTPKDALTKLEQLGSGATIADLGKPTQTLTGALARKDPGFGRKASQFLQDRAKGAGARLNAAASKALGTKGKQVSATLDGIRVEQKTRAGKLYEAAAQRTTNSDNVELFVNDLNQALGAARQIKVGGSPKVASILKKTIDSITQKTDDGVTLNSNTSDLIEVRKALGDSWFNMKKDFPHAAKKLKEQITKFDDLLPEEYRAANKIWSSSESVKESIETGTKLARMHPDDVAELLKGMSVADRDGILIGFARNVDDIVGNVQEGSKVTTLFNKPRTKKVLELLIPDKLKQAEFLNRIERENAFTATRHVVEGGSQTSANAEANAQLQRLSIEGIDLTSSGIVSKGIQWLTKSSSELPEGTINRLSKQLLDTGIDENFIKRLMETNLKNDVSGFISSITPGGIGGVAGAEAGSGIK